MYSKKVSNVFPRLLLGVFFVTSLCSINSCSNEEILNSSEKLAPVFYSTLSCDRDISLSGGEATWQNLQSISVTNASNAQKLNSNDVWESIPNGSGTYSCKGLKGSISFEKSGTFDIDGENIEIECDGDVTIEENLEVIWSIIDTISVLTSTNAQMLNVDDEWISIPDTTTICFDTKGFRVEADSLGTVKFSSPENQGFIIRKWDESEE